MATLKTTPNQQDVDAFLRSVEEPQKQADCFVLKEMMESITGEKPVMWGGSIVGFGSYHYQYESGREGDWFLTGFSPRKQSLTLYIMPGFERFEALMAKLGRYKTGKACLYIKRLEQVDAEVLHELVQASVSYLKKKYP